MIAAARRPGVTARCAFASPQRRHPGLQLRSTAWCLSPLPFFRSCRGAGSVRPKRVARPGHCPLYAGMTAVGGVAFGHSGPSVVQRAVPELHVFCGLRGKLSPRDGGLVWLCHGRRSGALQRRFARSAFICSCRCHPRLQRGSIARCLPPLPSLRSCRGAGSVRPEWVARPRHWVPAFAGMTPGVGRE